MGGEYTASQAGLILDNTKDIHSDTEGREGEVTINETGNKYRRHSKLAKGKTEHVLSC